MFCSLHVHNVRLHNNGHQSDQTLEAMYILEQLWTHHLAKIVLHNAVAANTWATLSYAINANIKDNNVCECQKSLLNNLCDVHKYYRRLLEDNLSYMYIYPWGVTTTRILIGFDLGCVSLRVNSTSILLTSSSLPHKWLLEKSNTSFWLHDTDKTNSTW